jgi:hypothetical protein
MIVARYALLVVSQVVCPVTQGIFPTSRFGVPRDYSPICASMGGHLSFHGAAAS